MERIFQIRNCSREVPGVLDAIEQSCRSEGLAADVALDMRLVAEEVLTNIVKYAYGTADEQPVELRLSASSGSVRMEFRDDGVPFDPLETPAPDVKTPLPDREIGGFGVHLVRSLVDEAKYARHGSRNVLILEKRV